MKISGIRTSIVGLPADEPLADAAENPNATRLFVTLQVETDEGPVGVGVTYFGGALTGGGRTTLSGPAARSAVTCAAVNAPA